MFCWRFFFRKPPFFRKLLLVCFADASHVYLGSLAGPVGEPFSFFSSLGGSWDVEMAVLAGFPFWHHFSVRILLINGRLWESQNLIIRCKGCQNHVFCYVRFFVVLGTILELKKHSKVHCDSLLAPPVDILTLRWNAEKNNAKKNRFSQNCSPGGGATISKSKHDIGGRKLTSGDLVKRLILRKA